MDISDSQLAQMIGGLVAVLVAYLVAYAAPVRLVIAAFIIISPFEIIETRYGSSTMLLSYVIALALYMRGAMTRVPLWSLVFIVLLAYMMSLSQVGKAMLSMHALFIAGLMGAFFIFYIIYNFVRETRDFDLILNALHVVNVLAIIYCLIQMEVGNDQVLFKYGLFEITIDPPRLRGGDYRLVGPFGQAPGLFAEYLLVTILLCFYELIYMAGRWKRVLLSCLLAANAGALLATANRGGIVLVVLIFPVFLWMFRERLGLMRMVSMLAAGIMLGALGSWYIIEHSEFNLAFERLAATRIEEGVPDTRQQVWRSTLERIPEKPLLGHGPGMKFQGEADGPAAKGELSDYPHNLYLYLMYTVGAVGLLAVLGFLATLFARVFSASRFPIRDDAYVGLARLGVLVLGVVFVDQLKIEFLRFVAMDYWFYLFIVFGMLLGVSDLVRFRRADSGAGAHAASTAAAS